MAFRLNHFLINATACVYAWLDFFNNTYQFSVCNGFYKEIGPSREALNGELNRRYTFFTIYKVLSSIPFALFSSFIVVSLTHRSFIELIDFMLGKRQHEEEETKANSLFKVKDENEIIYSRCDLDYVIDLLDKRYSNFEHKSKTMSFRTIESCDYTVVKVEKQNWMSRFLGISKYVLGK